MRTFKIAHNTPETREADSSMPVTMTPRAAPFEKPSAKATIPWDSEPFLFRPLIHAQAQAILRANLPYRLYLLGLSSMCSVVSTGIVSPSPPRSQTARGKTKTTKTTKTGTAWNHCLPNPGCWRRVNLGVLSSKMEQMFICPILMFIPGHLRRPGDDMITTTSSILSAALHHAITTPLSAQLALSSHIFGTSPGLHPSDPV
jgi:hypothetical protein